MGPPGVSRPRGQNQSTFRLKPAGRSARHLVWVRPKAHAELGYFGSVLVLPTLEQLLRQCQAMRSEAQIKVLGQGSCEISPEHRKPQAGKAFSFVALKGVRACKREGKGLMGPPSHPRACFSRCPPTAMLWDGQGSICQPQGEFQLWFYCPENSPFGPNPFRGW